jgi:hypothetical protein
MKNKPEFNLFDDHFQEVDLKHITTIKSIKIGSTDYLDLVSADDMVHETGTHKNIVKGYDTIGREFISFHLQLIDALGEVIDAGIYTLFRRYAYAHIFAFCRSHYSSNRSYAISHAISHAVAHSIGANAKVYDDNWKIFQTLLTEKVPLKYVIGDTETDVTLQIVHI